jgi:hypothetical protein
MEVIPMAQAEHDSITAAKLRRRMERAVERLISALDEAQGGYV